MMMISNDVAIKLERMSLPNGSRTAMPCCATTAAIKPNTPIGA